MVARAEKRDGVCCPALSNTYLRLLGNSGTAITSLTTPVSGSSLLPQRVFGNRLPAADPSAGAFGRTLRTRPGFEWSRVSLAKPYFS